MADNNNQKLELMWINKYKEEKPEPRILLCDKEKSYGDQNSENMLIHGDNLLALKALEQDYAGQVKCIYIDQMVTSLIQCQNTTTEKYSKYKELTQNLWIFSGNIRSFWVTIFR